MLEENDELIGHIMLTRTYILDDNKNKHETLFLGPISIKHYRRFGFKQAIEYGIRHIQNIPIEVVLACELVPNALKGISGTVNI